MELIKKFEEELTQAQSKAEKGEVSADNGFYTELPPKVTQSPISFPKTKNIKTKRGGDIGSPTVNSQGDPPAEEWKPEKGDNQMNETKGSEGKLKSETAAAGGENGDLYPARPTITATGSGGYSTKLPKSQNSDGGPFEGT